MEISEAGTERAVDASRSPALTDPMERLIASALDKAGIPYKTDFGGGNPDGLDFYLPWQDLHIEVKQFHSPRVSEQMSRADNVIVAQGVGAVRLLAQLIARHGDGRPEGRTPKEDDASLNPSEKEM